VSAAFGRKVNDVITKDLVTDHIAFRKYRMYANQLYEMSVQIF